MRIAIPIHSFEPGGVERVALRLAQAWQDAGEDVTVVLGRESGPCRPKDSTLNWHLQSEPIPTHCWETIWMIWVLWRYLTKNSVDAIFCPGNTYTIVCAVIRLIGRQNCPAIVVKISNDLERSDLPLLARHAYNLWLRLQGLLFDHFVAIAKPMLPQLKQKLCVDQSRLSVIPDPALDHVDIGPSRMSCRDAGRSGCHFASIGRLVPQKNIALMIEAFAAFSWPGDKLTIAGDGPERIRLEALARALRTDNKVHFAGHVDGAGQLLKDADVFVLSSDYEGMPATIVEALASGVPIAATDCCVSMQWLLQNERFGVLAPRGDPSALGRAMNAARGHFPPQAAMARFASQFTIPTAQANYTTLMAKVVARRRARKMARLRAQVREWRDGGV